MNFGVIALMVATRSWPAQRSGAPRPGPVRDRGGLRLGVAEELLDGDQVTREQRCGFRRSTQHLCQCL